MWATTMVTVIECANNQVCTGEIWEYFVLQCVYTMQTNSLYVAQMKLMLLGKVTDDVSFKLEMIDVSGKSCEAMYNGFIWTYLTNIEDEKKHEDRRGDAWCCHESRPNFLHVCQSSHSFDIRDFKPFLVNLVSLVFYICFV